MTPQAPSIRALGTAPSASATAAPATLRTAKPISRLRSMPIGLNDDRCTISHDFAHGLAHLRRIEAHHDHGIRAHGGCVSNHPIDRLSACLLQELRVFVDFP